MTIYKDATEYAALQVIPLSQVLDILDIPPPSKSHLYCFKIVDAHQEIIASTESEQDLKIWIQVLLNAKQNSL